MRYQYLDTHKNILSWMYAEFPNARVVRAGKRLRRYIEFAIIEAKIAKMRKELQG